jgi:hypothetical protein
MNEERDTDERLWHPWLRINPVLRVMLTHAGARTRGCCSELDGGVEDTPALGHDFLADPIIGDRSDTVLHAAPLSASS